ncbi:MAG: hypothetical protein ACE37H_06380 [Phycisphaeraceae bacterium]
MPEDEHNLTLLIRPGEKLSHSRGLPMMARVSDPGPSFPRLRRFFRPWRLVFKLVAVGIPFWVASMIAAVGGWLGDVFASAPSADPLIGTPTILALLPLGILALWAALVGLRDLTELGRHRADDKAYREALARLGDPDILTPRDLKSPGIREGLVTLGHFEQLLASVDRERGRVSALLLVSLHQSRRLVQRSVLDLIQTERRLAEWSARLGDESTYKAKLEQRRDRLAGAYPEILDRCLHAADRALARADEDPADLQRSVDGLLDSCQRALAAVERDGPAIDEQELLMHAAKAREAEAAGGDDDAEREDDESRGVDRDSG